MNHETTTPGRAGLLVLLLWLPACGGGDGSGGGGGPDTTAPSIDVSAPSRLVVGVPGDGFRVVFRADDDRDAQVRIVLDADGDPRTIADQTTLHVTTDANGATVTEDLDTRGVAPGRYTLLGLVDDGVNAPAVDVGAEFLVYPALAGVGSGRQNSYGVTERWVVFSVGEAEHGGAGGVVLNEDGDTNDGVMFLLDITDASAESTGFSVDVRTPSGLDSTANVLPADTGGIAWHRREADRGQSLNGDGDALDTVVAYVAPRLGIGPHTQGTGGASLTSGGLPGMCVVRFLESAHGTSLNGDTDLGDEVVAVLDYATNRLVSVFPYGIRANTRYVGGLGYGAYLVDEANEGNLNGDLDATDVLVQLVDGGGRVHGLGPSNVRPPSPLPPLAVSAMQPVAAYYVHEALAGGGASINGDADATDFVPTVLAGAAETVLSVPTTGINATGSALHLFCDGTRVVYTAAEEGVVDWNANGNAGDVEILFFTETTGGPVPFVPLTLPSAGLPALALDGGGTAAHVAPGWLALVVSEQANGVNLTPATDSDQTDHVLLLVDLRPPVPQVHNTGLVPLSPADPRVAGSTLPLTGAADDAGLVVQAAETANGDLNGDGDTNDVLLLYVGFNDPSNPAVLQDTGGLHVALRGGAIAVTAIETLTDTDHDGDGRADGVVFRVFDRTGAVLEPGKPCSRWSVPAADDGALWAWLRDEATEARDLNEDGDEEDLILGLWLR